MRTAKLQTVIVASSILADPDERRAPGAPFVNRGSGHFSPVGRFVWQHDAQFRQQATNVVDQRGALLDVALAGTMHKQARLLIDALHGTKRMLGRVTASAMAAASAASFLLRLPLMRRGTTNLGAIRRTVCLNFANSRAYRWAPLQAYMLIRHAGRLAMSSSSLARATSGLTGTGLPLSSMPCTAKTFFARSIPTVTIAMTCPLEQVDGKFDLSIVALMCRKPQPSQVAVCLGRRSPIHSCGLPANCEKPIVVSLPPGLGPARVPIATGKAATTSCKPCGFATESDMASRPAC